jgi:hypothetical protein
MHAAAARLDWAAPWLLPYRQVGAAVMQGLATGLSLAQALNLPTAPRRFVAQSELPPGEAYEAFIARTGCVPTRENLHDFFNGLVWHSQPLLKQRLNQLQAQALAQGGVQGRRGALRDALTLFDENGVLLQGPPQVLQHLVPALEAHDWQTLFISHRAHWAQARLVIFGHALLEKLCTAARKPLTGFVWGGQAGGAPAVLDPRQASAFVWQGKPFLPLPVLGVPGWCAANEEPAFYADSDVFRPLRALLAALSSADGPPPGGAQTAPSRH